MFYLTRIILLLFCILQSCDKDEIEKETKTVSLVDVFDAFYEKVLTSYVFWDIDTVNWSQVKRFRHDFRKLDISSHNDKLKAVKLYETITENLIDHHFSIFFKQDGIKGLSLNPGLQRKIESGKYMPSDNSFTDIIHLLSHRGLFFDVSYSVESRIVVGRINSTILFKTDNFNFSRLFKSSGRDPLDEALKWYFKSIEDNSVENIIFDLRGCRGGDIADLNLLLSGLINNNLLIGYTKFKQSRNQLGFSPLIPSILRGSRRNNIQSPKIHVFVDSNSASLAEIIACLVKYNCLGKIYGNTTYGALSPIIGGGKMIFEEELIDGFFTLYMASMQFVTKDLKSLEGKGVEPDVNCSNVEFITYLEKIAGL